MRTLTNFRALTVCLLFCGAVSVGAQPIVDKTKDYQLPVADVKIALAGNYGELRSNHFHAGLDFKTDQSIGHPVLAFDDGYVWRAVIYAYGYGYALYVRHPQSGLMTVYGHLDAFRPDIAQRVRQHCVAHEANNPDVYFEPTDFPVRRGEEIAKSGNTGSSGGPHVHFEIRGFDNDEFYDPLEYFRPKIADTTPPRLYNVYLYPMDGGTACGATTKQTFSLIVPKGSRTRQLNRQATAWGRVGVAIKAYDHMDGQANKFGVKYVRLYVDDAMVFNFSQQMFHYDERRYTNSLTDYAAWRNQRSMIMKCFREPGNLLRMINPILGDGVITVNEERPYHLRIELEDAHGNRTSFPFTLRGVRPAGKGPASAGGAPADASGRPLTARRNTLFIPAGQPVRIDSLGCRFSLDGGNLYTDVALRFAANPPTSATASSSGLALPCVSRVYTLGRSDIPIHGSGKLQIDIPEDCKDDPAKLYIANVTDGNRPCPTRHVTASDYLGNPLRASQSAAAVRAGLLEADINEFGKYAIRSDTRGPVVQLAGKPSLQRVTLRMSDAGSGILSWRGEIDGQFVPFDMDNRGLYVARPADFGIGKGKSHTLRMTVTDRCGNTTDFTTNAWF